MSLLKPIAVALLGLSVGLPLIVSPIYAGGLKDLGRSITYPLKKGAHNAGKTVSEGAGDASKGINHTGQAVQYPVRKAGENTSKTTHKVVGH